MEEYIFVNPTANPNGGVKVFTLPPFKNGEPQKEFTFRPPTLPPYWEEMFVAQEKHVVFPEYHHNSHFNHHWTFGYSIHSF